MRRNGSRRGTTGGPLMTDHLKDIDLELELLKRKRDMIEQQQHLLAMEQQIQSSRNYDFEPPSSNRDYSQLYDPVGPKNRGQFGRKRLAEPQWQYENTSKRTPPKKKGPQPQFNPRMGQVPPRPMNAGPANFRNPRPMPNPSIGLKNFPRGAVPLMSIKVKQSVGQKIANQNPKQIPPRKPITQNKVTKPKAAPANKLATQPLAERKKLVAAATVAGAQVDVNRMLLPDHVPTQQVTGRLELALGAIMKNIRESIIKDSPHASMLRSVEMQRVMKQAVRERIKTVMLGKVVGSMLEILAFYREEFPPETDVDIVNIALEAIGAQTSNKEEKNNLIESEDPEDFFKKNMSYLLETRITAMFAKLEEIYRAENPDADVSEAILKLEESTGPDGQEDSEEFQRFLQSNVKPREVRRFLPRLLKKNLPSIIRLLNIDSMYQSAKAEITALTVDKAVQIAAKTEPVVVQAAPVAGTIVKSPTASPIRPLYNLPFYVKIMGRPSLPKKKVMQQFMSQFNPKSIKKHRTIHNLLFVGFSEKSDFDGILAADGTTMGRLTLSIRVCGNKANDNSNTPQTNVNKEIDFSLDVSQSDLKNNDSVNSDQISPELDGQISALLSSIRKKADASNNKMVDETIQCKQEIVTNNETCAEKDTQTNETTENIPENDSNVEKVDNQESTEKAETGTEADLSKKVDKYIITIVTSSEEERSQESINLETDSEVSTTVETPEVTNRIENNEAHGKEETTTAPVKEDTSETPKKEAKTSEVEETNAKTAEPEKTETTNKTSGVEETSTKASEPEKAGTTNKSSGVEEPNAKAAEVEKAETTDKTSVEESNTKTADPEKAETTNDTDKDLELIENDRLEELKSATGRSTPTRAAARKANANITPCTIRTRRASRLAQN